MTDFLLELRSEEIPARMQDKARDDLARLFLAELARAGLSAATLETYATPRRLALIARDLPAETAAVREELKGPRTAAPPQALEGFLRKTGLAREQLVERDGILFALVVKPGRATASVLAEAIPAIVRAFPWPKSMRWGEASASTASIRWVRPLQGIVALLGQEIVPFEIAGVQSGAATVGHRFHHPGIITIGSANDYAEKLRACHVLIDPAERRRIIADGAAAAASAAGLTLVGDEGLLTENAGLTEWPVPLLGSFDPAFLEVPPEVIQLTMRTNQKYFACTDASGALAPNFICTANIEAADGGAAIVAGNEKVLAARLSDAKFFWEQDLKIPLEEQAKKLDQIIFHEKLGTLADKVERVAKLARWLVEEGIVKSSPARGGGPAQPVEGAPSLAPTPLHQPAAGPPPHAGEDQDLAALAETAARLSKADLVTGMVGEFPELQGIIGGYLARAQGQPPEIADAIRDHYKPVGQGDEVPTAPVTVAVSLADKLDTLLLFFEAEMAPTGSKDPFALRRAALGVLRLIVANAISMPLQTVLGHAFVSNVVNRFESEAVQLWEDYSQALAIKKEGFKPDFNEIDRRIAGKRQSPAFIEKHVRKPFRRTYSALLPFFADRLKVQQREAGVRHDLIDAVFALGSEDDLVRLLARVKALQSFVETAEGADLLAGYKRASNILKKEGYTPSPQGGEGRVRGAASSAQPAETPQRTLSAADAAGPSPSSSPQGGEGNLVLSYSPEPEEAQLIAALDSAAPRAAAAIEAEDFEGAMAALASLRAPVDRFFDKVIVNDPDPAKREARLALLARMRDAVHRVADFSRIEG